MAIGQILATAINHWLSEKPSRSLGMLARLSGASNSSVRRAAQNEGQPTQEVALGIAAIVMSDGQFREFVAEHYPVLKKLATDINFKQTDNDTLHHFCRSADHLPIIVLADTRYGVSEQQVVETLGERYVDHLEDLINAEILEKYVGHNDPDANFPARSFYPRWRFRQTFGELKLSSARKALSIMADVWERQDEIQRRWSGVSNPATAWIAWESLKPEAVVKLNRIQAKAVEEMFKIFQDESNHGDVLTFCGSLLNVVKDWTHECSDRYETKAEPKEGQ